MVGAEGVRNGRPRVERCLVWMDWGRLRSRQIEVEEFKLYGAMNERAKVEGDL